MAKASGLFVFFCLASILFADDNPTFNNGVGWDNGLSYRRYVIPGLWASSIVSGSARKSASVDTTVETRYYTQDSAETTIETEHDSSAIYSGTIRIELGKEMVRRKLLGLNAIAFGAYTYQKDRSKHEGTSTGNRTNSRNILSAGMGLEPVVWISNALSIGTDFGFQYLYTFGHDTQSSSDIYRTHSLESPIESHEFESFGRVSLTAGLNAFFWF